MNLDKFFQDIQNSIESWKLEPSKPQKYHVPWIRDLSNIQRTPHQINAEVFAGSSWHKFSSHILSPVMTYFHSVGENQVWHCVFFFFFLIHSISCDKWKRFKKGPQTRDLKKDVLEYIRASWPRTGGRKLSIKICYYCPLRWQC